MNVEQFLIKLFGRNCIVGKGDDVLWLAVRGWPIKELQNNIDLLAKEMHMEVERQAMLSREKQKKPKHERIEFDSKAFLLEMQEVWNK